MNPKLTIIIPCYNCADTLDEAVASCYEQGFTEDEFEIILCNDASTDGTSTIINKLQTTHHNIRVINHDINRGGGAARNTAAGAAAAPVFFCLDSDDILPPQTLNKMLVYLHKNKCDGVCFERSIKFRGRDTTDIVHIDSFDVSDTPVHFTSLLRTDLLSPVLVVFMYTKHAFNIVGGYPSHHGFDTQGFGWRFLSAGLKVLACPQTSYLHRVQFTTSYYLREYHSGKNNYHMQAILMEHLPLFSPNAQQKIITFPCDDFTRDVLVELQTIQPLLIPGYERLFGSLHYTVMAPMQHITSTPRNSWRGIWLRLRHRVSKFVNYN